MANDWTKNPAEIDTAEDKEADFFVDYFEWHPNAADDDLLVQDGAGNVLFARRAIYGAPNHEAAGVEKSERFGRPVYGINIVTIDGGTLYVHLR